jgi:hypothetical protein
MSDGSVSFVNYTQHWSMVFSTQYDIGLHTGTEFDYCPTFVYSFTQLYEVLGLVFQYLVNRVRSIFTLVAYYYGTRYAYMLPLQ